jgi:tetratricopeptide (TPR) repeat protein
VERGELREATQHYERARQLQKDPTAFDDVHVNALAELYMLQQAYAQVVALVRKAAAAARAGDVPLDLVAKRGLAEIHLGNYAAAAVRFYPDRHMHQHTYTAGYAHTHTLAETCIHAYTNTHRETDASRILCFSHFRPVDTLGRALPWHTGDAAAIAA